MRDDVAIPSPQGWLNVCDAIFHNARRRPLHPAIVDGGRTITYAELAALVAKTSGHLEKIGVRPGDIVGVALGDDADHIVALLAVAWLGAVILPMDVRWTAEEKRRIAVPFRRALRSCARGGERISDRRDRHPSTRHGDGASRPMMAWVPLCAGASSRCSCPCRPGRPARPRGRW